MGNRIEGFTYLDGGIQSLKFSGLYTCYKGKMSVLRSSFKSRNEVNELKRNVKLTDLNLELKTEFETDRKVYDFRQILCNRDIIHSNTNSDF